MNYYDYQFGDLKVLTLTLRCCHGQLYNENNIVANKFARLAEH